MPVLETVHSIFSRIAVAAITIFVGFIIAKLAGRITKRVLAEAELNRVLTAAGIKPLSDTLGTILEYVIYTATVLVVLQQFGLTKFVVGIIAALGIVVLAFLIILTVRDFVPNAIVGMFLRKKMKKHLGKNIRIGAVAGTLENIGIVGSVLKNKDEHYVPHLYASKQKITPLRAS